MNMQAIGPGYISPEAMVGGLAMLTRLRTLRIEFSTELPPPTCERSPDPPILILLPALTEFRFIGDNEYLEDLVARIDTPRLDDVRIEYCVGEVQTPQLSRFIGRSANLAQFRLAELTIDFHEACIILSLPQDECHQGCLSLTVMDPEFNFPFLCITNVLGQLASVLSNVGQLPVKGEHLQLHTRCNHGQLQHYVGWEWLPLLRPFRAVEALHVSGALAGYFGCALEEIDEEMVTEELPALHLLCLEDDCRIYDDRERAGSTERFLSLRQLSGRPVTIVDTEDEFEEALEESHL